jgi:hypothetical protein
LAQRAALAVGSVLLCLVFAELVVRGCIPVRNVGPSFTVYDAQYGKRLRPDASIVRVTPEFTMVLSTNSLGQRGPEPEPDGPSILFLGDSFTMGYGVNDGEEFPALVREALSERGDAAVRSVVNAGIGDSGNGRWILFLRTEARRYQPRLVVLQVHENDFVDNRREGLFRLGSAGELIERPIAPPGLERHIQAVVEAVPGLASSYLVGLLRQVRLPAAAGSPGPSQRRPASVDPLTIRLIEEALTLCEGEGWPALALLVDLTPGHSQAVRAVFTARGVPVIRLPGKRERPDLYYRVDGHWNAAGHRFAADVVLEKLDSLYMLVEN